MSFQIRFSPILVMLHNWPPIIKGRESYKHHSRCCERSCDPSLSGNKAAREMWEALTKIYQSDNHNMKMVLREKLRGTKMSRLEIVASYLTRIT